jgi:peptidyl-prolyl cis-trans isomerase D
MRKYAYSWGVKILFGLLALVFMFWGVSTGLFNQVHPIATVDSRRILPDQVDTQAQRLRQQLQQTYGANATAVLNHMNLREEALQMIIERMLIDDAARRLGIQITNSALEDEIASQAAFQVNGHFNFQAYQEVLRANNFEPAEYEHGQRDALLEQMLQKMVEQGVQISDDEAHRLYNLQNQNIVLSYFEVPFYRFTSTIKPTARQIADYYATHGDEFREPERVKIAYIVYDPAKLAADYNPTEKQIDDYYQRNLTTRYTHPEQMRARHILISVPKDASAQTRQKSHEKAENLAEQIRKGADFSKLALKYSDDSGTALQGGELGVFKRGQLIKQFEDGAFKLKPGQVGVVESPLGYHVVQVEAIVPAHVDSLAEARPQILNDLRRERGSRNADQVLNADLSAALSGSDMAKLAASHGLLLTETPLFAAGEPVVSLDPAVIDQAFKMQPGEIHAVTGHDLYLLKLLQREPSHIPPLEKIESKVRASYIRETAEADAREMARKLLAQIKTSDDFRKVAAANHLEVVTTPEFSRSARSVPGLGEFAEVTDAAATVPEVPGMIDRVLESGGNAYVFCLMSRTAPDNEQWQAASADFKKQLLAAEREQAWEAYLDSLKRRARITIDPNQLGPVGQPASM